MIYYAIWCPEGTGDPAALAGIVPAPAECVATFAPAGPADFVAQRDGMLRRAGADYELVVVPRLAALSLASAVDVLRAVAHLAGPCAVDVLSAESGEEWVRAGRPLLATVAAWTTAADREFRSKHGRAITAARKAAGQPVGGRRPGTPGKQPKYDPALPGLAEAFVRRTGRASRRALMGELGIPDATAAKILGGLEQRGVVGPAVAGKRREVLPTGGGRNAKRAADTEPAQCPPHPRARVHRGFCGACARGVGSEPVA